LVIYNYIFVVVYLIFKFIKKVIFAILTVVVLVFLVMGGIGALIYSDVNNLTSQGDYDLTMIYSSNEEYLFGFSMPIENQSLNIDKLSSVSGIYMSELDVDEIDKEDNEFVIIIDESRFESLISQEGYDLNTIEGFEMGEFSDYDLTLTKSEVIEIIESGDDTSKLIDILFEKNDLSEIEKAMGRPLLKASIENELVNFGLDFREVLFLVVVYSSVESEDGIVNLVEGYKEGDLEVYPNRISFKFLKLLPTDTVKGFLSEDEE
jgi:hypothetical protein